MKFTKALQYSIHFMSLIVLVSCHKSESKKGGSKAKGDTVLIKKVVLTDTTTVESSEEHKTTIRFNEFSIGIKSLICMDDEDKLSQTQKDSAYFFIDVGETIEGQKLSLEGGEDYDFTIEQRYETSITLSNEGPHCDLIDWKHFYSNWKTIKPNRQGVFLLEEYSEKDRNKFPSISISELKQQVKQHCGLEWEALMGEVKSPLEYPCGIEISRYYLRITAKRKDNSNVVRKIIVFEDPMGC